MQNFANCLRAAVIRHKDEETFYIPMVVRGHDELCLYPAFPESTEEEAFTMFYGQLEDWEAFDLTEAQQIHRADQDDYSIVGFGPELRLERVV